MSQKFTVRGEFLLPDNFRGGFLEALDLYTAHCRETWDNQPRLPSTLPDELCFEFLIDQGGKSHSTFAIETFNFEDFNEPMELEEVLQEDLEEKLCTD